MPAPILGRIASLVDIATDHTVQIPPSDNETHCYAPLVDTLRVVGYPDNGIGDARVDPQRAEECPCVLHARRGARNEHREPGHAEERDEDVAQPALARAVGDVADCDGQHRGGGVGGHREELCGGGFVAQACDDGGEEEGEGVEGAVGAHVDEGVEPGLPVADRGPEVGHAEIFVFGGGLLVGFQAAEHAPSVFGGEEVRFVGEVVDHPEGGEPDEDGGEAFENEDPGPAFFAADAFHEADGGGEEAAEGAGDGSRGEEDGGADAEFGALVPAGEVVVYAWEEARFGHAEEEAGGHEALEVVAEAHGHHGDAPDGHDDGDEDAGSEAFEQDVGERFEQGVGDEEDAEAGVVLAAGHVEGFLEAVEFGVADVGAVEEGDEVEEAEPGDQAEVELPEEFAVLRLGKRWWLVMGF